jgi:hypothetical protein
MSDGFKIIIILISFILIQLIPIYLTGLSLSKKKFNKSREDGVCIPQYIPFASILSDNTISTGEYMEFCIKNQQMKFMDVFVQPFRIMIDFLGGIGFNFVSIVQDINLSMGVLDLNITELQKQFIDQFKNQISSIQTIIIEYSNILSTSFGQIVQIEKRVNDVINGTTNGLSQLVASADNKFVLTK